MMQAMLAGLFAPCGVTVMRLGYHVIYRHEAAGYEAAVLPTAPNVTCQHSTVSIMYTVALAV